MMAELSENIEMDELHSSQDDGNVDEKDLIKEKAKKKNSKNKMQQLKREIEMVLVLIVYTCNLVLKFLIVYT